MSKNTFDYLICELTDNIQRRNRTMRKSTSERNNNNNNIL
jgi:hypothetical protein